MTRLEAFCCALLLALLALLAITAPAQEPFPTQALQTGHEKQVDHCSNAKTAPKAHRCDCKKEPTEMGCKVEDNKCKVYCRPTKCYCFHPGCDS